MILSLDFHNIDTPSETAAATPKPPVCMTCVLSALVPVAAASLLVLAAVLTPNERFPRLPCPPQSSVGGLSPRPFA